MHEIEPFSIPAMRIFVPEKLRPWIIIIFVIIFQFSGGIYLASVSEMTGSLALRQEDILMAGYASLVGMALTFAIMFRLKFRFTTRTAFLTCCAVIIAANLICMHTRSVPLLVAVCFVSGIFRMWATFECNSTIQLWLTPKRDLSIFFCFIYLLVQSCMQLSGLITVYTSVWAKWEYMHWLIIGLLGVMMIATLILFHGRRSMPRLPLFGIDWLGALMWGLTLLCIIFVCTYGEHYDWFNSMHIRMATVAAGVLLALNLWRASFIRHPFISLKTWCYPAMYTTFFIYIIVDILLAPSHVFEHAYVEAVLGYDASATISLNWVVLTGTVIGATFSYYTFALRKWKYKTMTVIAFAAITVYLMYFYFMIDYNLPWSALVLPLFLRSFGYVIIAICFLTVLSRIPFERFFEAISVQAFVSAGFGGVLGVAIVGRVLTITMKKNSMLLGATLDHVNPLATRLHPAELYGALQQHSLMVSFKEIYGWLTLAALACLLLFMLKESDFRPIAALHPRYRAIRRYISRQIKH